MVNIRKTQLQLIALLALSISFLNSCGTPNAMEILTSAEVCQNTAKTKEINYVEESALMIVEVRIENQPLRFIFDTGAGSTVISKEAAEKLNLEEMGSVNVEDAYKQKHRLSLSKIDSLSLGGLCFTDVGVIINDFNSNASFTCFDIDGIIGMNMISQQNWIVDYDTKKLLALAYGTELSGDDSFNKIPFIVNGQKIPFIDLMIAGQTERFMVDTGKNGLRLSVSNSVNLENSSSQIIGTGGSGLFNTEFKPDTTDLYKVEDISSADFNINAAYVSQSPRTKSLLGNGVLANRFNRVGFDFQNNELYFQYRVSPNSLISSMYGISLKPTTNGISIASKHLNFSPEVDQLTLESPVVEINGVRGSNCDVLKAYTEAKRLNKSIELIYSSNGEEHKIVLEKRNF